jgi:hypothetical protein
VQGLLVELLQQQLWVLKRMHHWENMVLYTQRPFSPELQLL